MRGFKHRIPCCGSPAEGHALQKKRMLGRILIYTTQGLTMVRPGSQGHSLLNLGAPRAKSTVWGQPSQALSHSMSQRILTPQAPFKKASARFDAAPSTPPKHLRSRRNWLHQRHLCDFLRCLFLRYHVFCACPILGSS